jgi:hypothetical protein
MSSFLFHLPADVVTVFGDSVTFEDTLQIEPVKRRSGVTSKVAAHLFLRNTIHTETQSASESEVTRGLTYARKSALVWALAPLWRHILKWLPPMRLSQQAPMSGFP